ncbi:hypothetical protein [Nocardia carnea]|uniref:hypothetical protein n=1 Tax=Nocardia carnea TaxID=37328 RepID=UPI0024541E3A|nr:hypothetical protein [Nocardia carnea]
MSLPDWRDDSVGTMVRSGLWLVTEVGEGNIFTKQQLREAFPGVQQIDRRVRDLRKYGWKILANTEDAQLRTDEQRFAAQGVPVWDQQARRKADAAAAVTAVERSEVLARDGFMCTVCGITGGEAYLDNPTMTAVLSVVRRRSAMPDGREETLLVTECKRCLTGARTRVVSAAEASAAIGDLDETELLHMKRWIARGRRGSTPLDRAWAHYWNLPEDAKREIESVHGL